MYVSESKGPQGETSDRIVSCNYFLSEAQGPRVFTFAPYDTDHAVQTGWRGGKRVEAPDRYSAGVERRLFSGGTWAGRNADYLSIERARLATTPSPLVRSTSLPVHERTVEKRKCIGTAGVLTTYTNRWRYQDVSWTFSAPSTGQLPGGAFPPPSLNTVLELRSEVASRMKAARPTKPLAGLAQFVGELRDFPKLVAQFADLSKLIAQGKRPKAGDSYLGYQFGVAPMISDIRKCAEVIANGSGPLEQFLRDSGELVSRSVRTSLYTTRDDTFNFTASGIMRSPGPSVGGAVSAARVPRTSFRTDIIQATGFGLYEYFVGDPTDSLGRMASYAQRAQKLLGTNLTEAVLWELTPWSWMIDWFVDIGGLLAYQVDVSDYSLALRRGGWTYMQRSSRLLHGDFVFDGVYYPKVLPATITRTKRYAALSPAGIEIDWSELSPFQLSILAALGLSRKGV